MSIIGSETFLPGVLTEVESDYSYGYDSSLFGTTDSVLLIGTAFNGPVGVPVEIYNPEHGRYVFGKAYDSKSKQEATLVAAIEDAYQRGNRTIYGVRISGKQIQKSFDFALDTSLQLRVSSIHPTNEAKDYFMVYDSTNGDEKIKLYKPANKATIVEKMQGLVESDNAVLVTEIRLNRDYGITKDSNLVDMINTVNEHAYNNVFQLAVVDESGAEVTNVSIEAQNLPVGALHPGIYMIGRDKSLCTAITEVDYQLIKNDDTANKPFMSFEDNVFKKLVTNTDVSLSLPVYAQDMDELRAILRDSEVFMFKDYDFLETQGAADRAFAKNKTDYEEVNISNFDIYQRLGSGFAVTARAEKRTNSKEEEIIPRIKETPVGDENRILSLGDGIYSMLENLNARYRVLTSGHADSKISGRLPRPDDFKVTTAKSADILGSLIKVTPKVEKDNKFSAKSYKFQINAIDDENLTDLVEKIYTDKVFKVVPAASEEEIEKTNVPNGTLILEKTDVDQGVLKRAGEGKFETLNSERLLGDLLIVDGLIYEGVASADGTVFEKITVNTSPGTDPTFRDKEYVLAENNGKVFAFDYVGEGNVHVLPLGDINTMLSDNQDKTVVYAQYNHFETNPISITSAILDGITLEELVEYLNDNDNLKAGFSFELTGAGYERKDDYVTDVAEAALGTETLLEIDREFSYDYNKYIPYKTNDNFARQLAQHCTYTSLKTAPTHGVVGTTRFADLGLNSIANRVDQILGLELDLYAKNASGRNMLDRNNMPYPIGKNISVVFTQYFLNMSDGYRFVSNGASGYAGMVSQLPLDQSSTSQPIDLPGTMFELTNYQLTRLTQKGVITIKQSYTRGLVITDGVTQAPAESPFRRLAATRVIGAVEELIREAVEPYIGKQNHAANRNSMQTAIKSNLDKIKDHLRSF